MNGNFSLYSPCNSNFVSIGQWYEFYQFPLYIIYSYKCMFVTTNFPPFFQNTLGGTSVKRQQCASGQASCIFHTWRLTLQGFGMISFEWMLKFRLMKIKMLSFISQIPPSESLIVYEGLGCGICSHSFMSVEDVSMFKTCQVNNLTFLPTLTFSWHQSNVTGLSWWSIGIKIGWNIVDNCRPFLFIYICVCLI